MDLLRLRASLISRKYIGAQLLNQKHEAKPAWATRLINVRCGGKDYFSLEWVDGPAAHVEVVALHFGNGGCRVQLNRHLRSHGSVQGLLDRLFDSLVLIAACQADEIVGTVMLNIGDLGVVPGLAFCDSRADYPLIPDPYYVNTALSAALPDHFPQRSMPWAKRLPVVFWRGSTTGVPSSGDWRDMDRIRLCRIAAEHPDAFDAGITGVLQVSPADAEAIRGSGLLRPHVRMRYFHRYRFQLDIDGNTNSWGCFNKLLTGSPLLKVASRHGYRQWYYDRLKPWVHYVPVAADLSDLMARVEWLRANDQQARDIGQAGRDLAISMTLAHERQSLRHVVAAQLPSVV